MIEITDPLQQQLAAYIGVETGPYHAWDRVNRAMIRHWCEAVGDDNPVYRDSTAAAALGAGEGEVLSPPTMLQSWAMVGLGGAHPPASDSRDAMAVLPLLDGAGYSAVVATNCEQEYLLPLCEGDAINTRVQIEAISARKQTAMGEGYFVTQLTRFYNQRDELVGVMRFRLLKFRPSADSVVSNKGSEKKDGVAS